MTFGTASRCSLEGLDDEYKRIDYERKRLRKHAKRTGPEVADRDSGITAGTFEVSPRRKPHHAAVLGQARRVWQRREQGQLVLVNDASFAVDALRPPPKSGRGAFVPRL